MGVTTMEIVKPNVLVVEGKDELLFFQALVEHLGIHDVQIMPIGGKTGLSASLKALASAPGFRKTVLSLGVVRDADRSPSAAFQSVQGALRAAGLPTPSVPLVPVGDHPAVAIMIIPRQDACGMLEDVCLEAVKNEPAMSCVEGYFDCLAQMGYRLPANLSKAKAQVFLASKPEPDKRLGEAAQAGYWPFERAAFDYIKAFLGEFRSPVCS